MRILYGVQATGQGHISRARAMAHALKQHPDVDVTWLFSGRPRERLFDMEPFGDFQHRAGLTFVTEAGRLRYRKTIMANRYWQFIRDVQRLDVKAYDLVVTDYEPVTAWAGKLKGQSVLGIGHQYAFGKNTPVEGRSLAQHVVMSLFAPGARGVGARGQRRAAAGAGGSLGGDEPRGDARRRRAMGQPAPPPRPSAPVMGARLRSRWQRVV